LAFKNFHLGFKNCPLVFQRISQQVLSSMEFIHTHKDILALDFRFSGWDGERARGAAITTLGAASASPVATRSGRLFSIFDMHPPQHLSVRGN